MCGLTGGGGSLWFGQADHLIHMSNNWVHLASGPLLLHKALVEMIEILDDHLTCCQAIGESNLSENLLQNQVGETPNIYVFECSVVKAGSVMRCLRVVQTQSSGSDSEFRSPE